MTSPSEILDRAPPHDLEAERGVIGSVLIDPKRLDEVVGLRPEDFHDRRNGKLFGHFLAMRNGGAGAVDVTLLHGKLKEAGDLEAVGGAAYLAEVMQGVPVAAHARHYAEVVRDHAIRRAIIHNSADLLKDAYSGQVSAAGLVRQARAGLETVADGAQQNRFKALSCAELDAADFALEYLVEGVLVAGQPCLVAGGKKSLKTSIIIDLGLSLAMGGFFLGKLKVHRACRVGIMSGESGMVTIQETARRICSAAGYRLADVGNLIFADTLPQFGKLDDMDALRGFVEGNELEVLVLDPAYLCMPGGDAGNLFIQGGMLRTVNEVCGATGATMILAHHTRKGGKADPYEPPELEDIAWAGFQEWARQWLLVGRREKYEPGTGEHRLWLSAGGSAGHSGLWALNIAEGTNASLDGRFWEVEVLPASEAREDSDRRRREAKEVAKLKQADEQIDRDRKRLCAAMAKHPDGETKTTLRTLAGMGGDRFNATLATLLSDGFVVECEVLKPGKKTPLPAYKLADENPPEVAPGQPGQSTRTSRVPQVVDYPDRTTTL
jgi:hypothetical protein